MTLDSLLFKEKTSLNHLKKCQNSLLEQVKSNNSHDDTKNKVTLNISDAGFISMKDADRRRVCVNQSELL